MRITFILVSCLIVSASAYTTNAKLRCGYNEVEDCLKECPPERSCRNRGIFFNCAEDSKSCTRKCVCAKGHYRNSIGECVTEEQCEQCNKPNEFYSCNGPCDNECDKIGYQNRTNCPIVNIRCTEWCYCDDGYARDEEGNCIPVDKCNAKLRCGYNEVEDCLKECPPERSCRNRGIFFNCAEDSKSCTRKCVCAKGHYRNSIGECVTEEQCEQCNKPNEFYSCNGPCDNECDKIGYQNRTNCPIVNIRCTEWCYCDDGYARDEEGNCIPVDKCKSPCRDPNEEYINSRSCPPDECISLVASFKCNPKEVSQMCCRCKPGYLREDEDSHCVPICQCPAMRNAPECKCN